jgi:Tfp pilus assembly protein PilE
LLIVVAIIAILAAIAVPNFLEAQVRAKVSRVKADMRSVATGLEAYVVDNNKYPPAYAANQAEATLIAPGSTWSSQYYTINPPPLRLAKVTTPIAYLTSVPADPFSRETSTSYRVDEVRVIDYNDRGSYEANVPNAVNPTASSNGANIYRILWGRQFTSSGFLMRSEGPTGGFGASLGTSVDKRDAYDPTNGTVSTGDIFYLQGVGPDLTGGNP